jgi:hypothetical protein
MSGSVSMPLMNARTLRPVRRSTGSQNPKDRVIVAVQAESRDGSEAGFGDRPCGPPADEDDLGPHHASVRFLAAQ